MNMTKQSRPITPLSHYSESWFTGPTMNNSILVHISVMLLREEQVIYGRQ